MLKHAAHDIASSSHFADVIPVGTENHQSRLVFPCLGISGTNELQLELKRDLDLESLLGDQGRSYYRTETLFKSSAAIPSYDPSAKAIPPHSWLRASDQRKRNDVTDIVTAGFEMARRTPMRRRDQALREASFQVPHEIARLNPDAQQFRLEDMGLLPAFPEGSGHEPPFDMERDARAFLYFPNGAAKATAAFVAINAEFKSPVKLRKDGPVTHKASESNMKLLNSGMLGWVVQAYHWSYYNPDVYGRIQTGQLPVIINYRQMACGSLYDIEAEMFPDPTSFSLMMSLS
ncbi:hypothetical protein J7T55_000394 [Diaporthe amygdali]|uniref:uncharacterized protein n=1 Tax=Phomopsis amygdali TaxID=1214568 RepID=UPI0022FEDFE4|nr:uncharacterized protein J7T55_000394 [Diaporthe amygdali]KAJ0109469.1 hypothetical protein J7T55_000394 [Diaporthe amygdali]